MPSIGTLFPQFQVGSGVQAPKRITYPAFLMHEAARTQVKSANYTLAEIDNGVITIVDTDAVVITLPATVVGTTYIVVAGANDGTILLKIAPNAADKIMGGLWTAADNKYIAVPKVTQKYGDGIVIVGDGVNGWMVQSLWGGWVKEA